jgi:hypothetical protein
MSEPTMRPPLSANPDTFEVHVRSIESHGFATIVLVGNTSAGNSVCLKVNQFKQYMYLRCDLNDGTNTILTDAGDFKDIVDQLNKSFNKFKHGSSKPWMRNIIAGYTTVRQSPVIGFTNDRADTLLKIDLAYFHANKSFQAFIKQTPHVVLKRDMLDVIIRMVHEDFDVVDNFIHSAGITLQSHITIPYRYFYFGTNRITNCQIEESITYTNLIKCPLSKASLIQPILSMTVTTRAKLGSTDLDRIYCHLRWSGLVVTNVPQSKYIVLTTDEMTSTEIEHMGKCEDDDTIRDTRVCTSCNHMVASWVNICQSTGVDCFTLYSNANRTCILDTVWSCIRAGDTASFGIGLVHPARNLTSLGNYHPTYMLHTGSTRLDLRDLLKKSTAKPALDGYTIESCVEHPTMFKAVDKERLRDAFRVYSYGEVSECPTYVAELHLIERLVDNSNALANTLELSKATNTAFRLIVEGGQQIRVWNKLKCKFHQSSMYVNRWQLESNCIITTGVLDSYPDPPSEAPCTSKPPAKRRKVNTTISTYFQVKTVSDVSVPTVEPCRIAPEPTSFDRSTFIGGLVRQPTAGLYCKRDEQVFTFDYASMYPSLIQSEAFCYRAVVYDKRWLSDRKLKTRQVRLHGDEFVTFAIEYDGKPIRTILPETIRDFTLERARVKLQMKTERDPYKLSMLDAKQLGCKLVQNSVYGFLGVEKKGRLPLPVIMCSICRVGQHVIKHTDYGITNTHYGVVVYGDTDSIMATLPLPLGHANMTDTQVNAYYEEKCKAIAVDITNQFRKPNRLEAESRKFPFLLLKKKNYAAIEYGAGSWDIGKLTVKGLGIVKRDRCMWVRNAGVALVDNLLHFRLDNMLSDLSRELDKIIDQSIHKPLLELTSTVKPESEYKQESHIQLQVSRKMYARTGKMNKKGDRIRYVVTEGSEQLFMRGETLQHVIQHGLSIDRQFYVQQLFASVKPIINHIPESHRFKVNKLFDSCRMSIERQRGKQICIVDFFE